jgi:osmotically-inducible protein OsmY
MNMVKSIYTSALAFALIAVLPGCATYEKCGLEGCPGDAKITANVQAQLSQHEDIGPRVHVQTLNGVVYLNGSVSEGLQRTTAETVASQTPGVAKVVDDIYVSR